MAHATYDQTNFLGGEWSKLMQGRSDNKNYRSAMNLCYNGLPVEQGAWTRRPGTRALAPTFKGKPALIRPLYFQEDAPYLIELTDSYARFFYSSFPVITQEVHPVVSVSNTNPAIMTISDTATFSTGDEVAILFANGADATAGRLLRQRSFTVTPQPFSPPAWSSTTTYGVGDNVSSSGVNYTSILSPNLNQTPASSPTYWQAIGSNGTNKYKLTDTLTGTDLDGTQPGCSVTNSGALNIPSIECVRILRLSTPYASGAWASVRIAQNQNVALLMNGTNQVQALYIAPNLGTPEAASAAIVPANFRDGPFLDPINGSTATVSGTSGLVTVSVNFATWVSTTTYGLGDWVASGGFAYRSLQDGNLNNLVSNAVYWEKHDAGTAVTGPDVNFVGFQATDVGRLMRFFNTPANFDPTATYSAGNTVWYNGLAYQASAGVGAAVYPDANPLSWTLLPTGQVWTYGKITQVTTTNSATVLIQGPPLLYNVPCALWRLGVYSDTTGYPTCGHFYKGRFWFGGAVPNRFDCTMIDGVDRDGTIRMSPTAADGTVLDTSGISYTFEADDKNDIRWFAPDQHGLIAGTAGGEWLIAASTLNDPITPTSIDANRVSKYRVANVEPKKTPMSIVFVQAYQKKVLEFISDVFSGKYSAPHLSETAKHLTNDNVVELGYQEETSPTLWMRTAKPRLIGLTYRRVSSFATEAPTFAGWHQHALGHGRTLECLAVGPTGDGSMDTPAFVTYDGTYNYVESMTQLFDETTSLYDAWFLDGAIIPDQMIEQTVGGQLGMTFTGLYYYIGKTLTVFAAGLDLGEHLVNSDGTIFVPYGTGVAPALIDYSSSGSGLPFFTSAYVAYINSLNLSSKNGGIGTVGGTTLTSKTVQSNPNGSTSKIQSYLPATWVNQNRITVDWNNTFMYIPSTGFTTIYQMNLATGALVSSAVVATLLGIGGAQWSQYVPACVDNEGNIYTTNGTNSSNYDPFYKISKSLSLTYAAGAASTFGPPGTNGIGMNNPNLIIEANSAWLLNMGLGIQLERGDTGAFLAGNGSTQPSQQGVNQVPWTLEGNLSTQTFASPGRPLVIDGFLCAAGYISQYGSSWPNAFSMFVVGVTDGTPTGGGVGQNNGSTGKKGKGKKGASQGGVFHYPTVQNPLVTLNKIGTLAASAVDSRWTTFNNISGNTIDQSDNSFILQVSCAASSLGSAWSNVTAYTPGQIVTENSGTLAWQCIQANTNVDPSVDTAGQPWPGTGTYWKVVPCGYIIKYATGAYSGLQGAAPQGLAWKVPIPYYVSSGLTPQLMQTQSRVKGGLYGFVAGATGSSLNYNERVWLVDTTTGNYFVGLIPGPNSNGSLNDQAWDDQTQSVVYSGYLDLTQPGAPTPLNGTVSQLSAAGPAWFRLYIGNNVTRDTSYMSPLTQQPSTYTFVYSVTQGGADFPCIAGFNYQSQAQTLRAVDPQQAGTMRGPAFGSLRSSKNLAVLMQGSLGLEFGTDFVKMVKASLKDRETGLQPQPITPTNLTATQMFSGMWRDALEGKTDFDAMISWRIVRPWPATVVALGPNISTEDR
jgi:hypothetical protein